MINEGEYKTDLAEDNGGGYVAVISFIFNLFLLMKTHKRLVLFFDEAFTQISKRYFCQFFSFVHQLSKDLGVDLLLITHDPRIEQDMVDHLYVVENGKTNKVK